jgi:hypothetical protein
MWRRARRNFLSTAAGIAASGTALALAAAPAGAVSVSSPQVDGELTEALGIIIECSRSGHSNLRR